MKQVIKLLLLATLLVLLVGIASASDVSGDTATYAGDAMEAAHDTQMLSQTESPTGEVNKNNEITDKNQDKIENDTCKRRINKKNTGETNVKGDSINASSWVQLDSIISNAEGDTTIILNNTETYNYEGTISLYGKNIVITIDGQGHTINGQQHQVFNVNSGANLVLKNIIITNASASTGGAIYNERGNLTIINSTLSNCTTTGTWVYDDGGAIYNERGNLTIINSTLSNNNATRGGAIYNYEGNVTITNSTLKDNTAKGTELDDGGGAIYNIGGILTVTDNSILVNNTATVYGGAIYNGKDLNITDSILDNNRALGYFNESSENYRYGYGGAIYTSCNLNITNTTLNNNFATLEGGAIFINGIETYIWDSTLNNNTVQGFVKDIGKMIIYRGVGGAIHNNKGIMTITGTDMTHNSAGDYGGAIYNHANLTITNSNFTQNTANRTGGAIDNMENITITNINLTRNNATRGGAISNYEKLIINKSALKNNNATYGGAIYNSPEVNIYFNVTDCDFTENYANETAAISYTYKYGGILFIVTSNNFTRNTALNNETLLITKSTIIENNNYDSTDISLKTMNLTVNDNRKEFQQKETIELNFTIELTNPTSYDEDILKKINKTVYINNKENVTTKENKYILSDLKPDEYMIYYKTCNRKSDNINFKVMVNSKITTDKKAYDYYEGINNKITLNITDESEEKGTIDISVKEDDKYANLSAYYNIKDGYTILTETIAERLENLYTNLNKSYTINITYYSNLANPNSTEFTLNIIKQRNTTIIYKVLNNTEGNVKINITVTDTVYKTPVPDARIEVTGNITLNTTSGVINDTSLKQGKYTINVKFNQTEDYKASKTTINFNVEIDKDKKIAEMEEQISNLTNQLDEANKKIEKLNRTAENLTQQLEEADEKIEGLNKQVNNLTQELEDARTQIGSQNKTINNLTKQLSQANKEIEKLNNTINNLTDQLDKANKEIEALNKQVNNLTKQLKNAKTDIKKLNTTIKNLNKQIKQKNSQIKKLNKEIKNLTGQLDSAQNEIKNLTRTINELLKVSDTKITVNTIKARVGTTAKLTVKVTDTKGRKVNEGKVVFKVNGKTLKDETGNTIYAGLVNGTASIKYKAREAWMKNTSYVEAVYSGSKHYTTSRTKSTKALKITPGKVKLTLDKNTIKAKSGQRVTLRANVLDANGDRITNGKAVFKLNGKTLKDKNGNTLYAKVVDGEAILNYTIPTKYSAKTYKLSIVYASTYYERTETNGKLVLEKKAVTITAGNITTKNTKTTIKATIRDETGKLLVTPTKLAIKVNGKTILKNVNSTNGRITVSFTSTLRPGIYEMIIISGENSIYEKGTLTTILKI